MADMEPDLLLALSSKMSEEVVGYWRCFDSSRRRADIKENIRLAIAKAVVDELIRTTHDELEGHLIAAPPPDYVAVPPLS